MKSSNSLLAIAPLIVVAACSPASEQETAVEAANTGIASAVLAGADGTALGSASLQESEHGLALSIKISGIPEGPHGFHLHTTGDCSATDFTSAGGHLNPFGKSHGAENPDGKHLGDLPNLDVNASGSGEASFAIDGAREEVLAYLFDEDGTAIVVHAGPDDNVSDPAGAAGPRIACGVLIRS